MNKQDRKSQLLAELYRLPLRFAAPVIMGLHPHEVGVEHAWVLTATGTYVDLNGPKFITNWHVLEAYRQKRAEDDRVRFQILDAIVDVESRLWDENPSSDLAVFNVHGLVIEENRGENLPALSIYPATPWPPEPAAVAGDIVVTGGWPEGLRRGNNALPEVIHHGSLSYAGIRVCDVFDDRINAKIDWAELTYDDGTPVDKAAMIENLSGLSGSPVFIDRGAPGVLKPFLLSGFVMGYNDLADKLIITRVENVKSDGHLWKNTKR